MLVEAAAGAAIVAAVFNIGGAVINYQNQVTQYQAAQFQYGMDAATLREQKALAGKLRPFQQRALARESEQLNLNYGANKQLLEFQKEMTGLERLKQRTGEALAKGDTMLALGEATKAARIETAQIQMAGAAGGASAFTRAYAQMSVNRLATQEQKLQALKQEGLLNEKEYGIAQQTISLKQQTLEKQRSLDIAGMADKTKAAELQYESQQKEFNLRIKAVKRQEEFQREMAGRGQMGGFLKDVIDEGVGLFTGGTKINSPKFNSPF